MLLQPSAILLCSSGAKWRFMARIWGQVPFYAMCLEPGALLCHAFGVKHRSMAWACCQVLFYGVHVGPRVSSWCVSGPRATSNGVRLGLSALLRHASGVKRLFVACDCGQPPFYGMDLGPSTLLCCASGAECPSMSCLWGRAPFYGMCLGPSALL